MDRKLLHADNNLTRDHDHFKQTLLDIFLTDQNTIFVRETCELFSRRIVQTGRIPTGNLEAERPVHSSPEQPDPNILWKISNEEDFRTVSDRFCIQRSADYPQRTRGNARDSYRFMLTSHLVNSPYFLLVYTTQVNSAFRAL